MHQAVSVEGTCSCYFCGGLFRSEFIINHLIIAHQDEDIKNSNFAVLAQRVTISSADIEARFSGLPEDDSEFSEEKEIAIQQSDSTCLSEQISNEETSEEGENTKKKYIKLNPDNELDREAIVR